MDLSIQPQSSVCFVTQQPFEEGQRVVSFLVRAAQTGELLRHDVLASEAAKYETPGPILCRWVRIFKPRKANENPERELKLTAENLFMTLVDPASETEMTEDTVRLLQFLALMLERKRVLRPKGRTADRSKNLYEHAKTKQMIEVPAGELTPEFFVQVQEQLSVLVGGPKTASEPEAPAAGEAEAPAPSEEPKDQEPNQ